MDAGLFYILIWLAGALVVGVAGNPGGAGVMVICACIFALCREPIEGP